MRKRVRQVLSLCLIFTMMLSSITAFAATTSSTSKVSVPKLTKLSDYNVTVKPTDGIKMFFTGLLEQDITVGDNTRTAKLYIPENAQQGDYFVVLTVPDGVSTEDFMVKSGWMDLADKENLCLFVMEPVNKKWGSVENERPYVEAAYAELIAGKYYLPFPTFYIVGYGNGGTALQQYAMTNSITVASQVYIDASNINSTYLKQMQETTYKDTDITFGEVPVPTWIINKKNTDTTKNVIDYWKTANECTDSAYGFNGGNIYFQKNNTDSIFTPKSISKVAILEKKINYNDPAVAKMLYDDFLSETTRYGGAAGGNTLAARPNYKALGVEFKTMTVDGYKREYLVYVPKAIKESSEKAPVVFSLHGANQTYKMMFDISRWFEVADARNFILVMPTATVNPNTTGKAPTPTWETKINQSRADDLKFMEILVKEIDKEYNIDGTRRYLSGQSNGCMMSNYVGMMMPDYFAAIGATSGPILGYDPSAIETSTKLTPFFMLFGEKDLWSWQFTEDGPVRSTLNYWITRNGAGNIDSINGQYINNRYNNYIWINDAGVPLVRYTMTNGRGHSFLPDEMFAIWDEWFALWKQDSNGNSVYMTK